MVWVFAVISCSGLTCKFSTPREKSLSSKEAEDIFHHSRVDIRHAFGGIIEIKRIQEMETVLSKVVFGVHGNCNEEMVAIDLWKHSIRQEKHLLECRAIFVNEGVGFRDTAFDSLDPGWKTLLFHPIYGYHGFPKGSAYETTERGKDVSWKHAIHFEWGEKDAERIEVSLAEFKRRGGVAALFSRQAVLLDVPRDDAGYLMEYRLKVPSHQNTNRSVGNIVLSGIIDLDAEVTMTFAGQEGVTKVVSLRTILHMTYAKVGDRKLPLFLYAFAMKNGKHQLWFWDKVPEIKEFVMKHGVNVPGYLWHCCKGWGLDTKPLKALFQASFDSEMAVKAMNSKWSTKKQKLVDVEVTGEAAEFLHFGTSPFILAEGETMKKRAKPVINASNLRGKVGGIDADEIDSVDRQSHADTVFHDLDSDDSDESGSDDEEEEDDDVSAMGDDEGFEEEEEATVKGNESSGESESEAEENDEDSAFATKADLDELKRKGKKVRSAKISADERVQQLEKEKAQMQ